MDLIGFAFARSLVAASIWGRVPAVALTQHGVTQYGVQRRVLWSLGVLRHLHWTGPGAFALALRVIASLGCLSSSLVSWCLWFDDGGQWSAVEAP